MSAETKILIFVLTKFYLPPIFFNLKKIKKLKNKKIKKKIEIFLKCLVNINTKIMHILSQVPSYKNPISVFKKKHKYFLN